MSRKIMFVWGIKSDNDLTMRPAGLYTMNDFEIDYLPDRKKYIYSVEAIYLFEHRAHEVTYLKDIYTEFTRWMKKKGYNTDYKPSVADLFGRTADEFDSIEELYADFKLKCMGFARINSSKNKENKSDTGSGN